MAVLSVSAQFWCRTFEIGNCILEKTEREEVVFEKKLLKCGNLGKD